MNKKLILTMLLSMFMLSMTFATTNDAKVYYSFDTDDTTGTTMLDISGTPQYNGTCTNMASNCNTVSGLLINSSDFDYNNDYIAGTPYSLDIQAGNNYTISGWINADTLDNGATSVNYNSLMGYGVSGGRFFYVWVEDSGFVASMRDSGGSSSVNIIYNPSGGVNLSQWYHYVLVVEGLNVKMYIDNVYRGQMTESATVGNVPLFIGTTNNVGSNINYFDGRIDEFAIYERVLNTTEISQLYNDGNGFNPYSVTPTPPGTGVNGITNNSYYNTSNLVVNLTTTDVVDSLFYYLNNTNYIVEDGLVAYYNFDGNYLDATSNGNDGTNSGSTLNQQNLTGTITGATFDNTNSPPVGEYSMSFDGINDYVDLGDNNVPKTMCLWFNIPTGETQTQDLVNRYKYLDKKGFRIYYDSGAIRLILNNGTSTPQITKSFTPDSNWHFVCSIIDNGDFDLYLDEETVTSGTYTGSLEDSSNILLGTYDTSANYFNGSIDDVRIYDRALTTEEIADIYANNSLANDVRQSNAHRFNFEEGSGTTTKGQPIIPLDVQQVQFDGINDYVSTTLNFNTEVYSTNNEATVSFWMKSYNDISSSGLNIISANDGGNGRFYFRLDGGRPQWAISNTYLDFNTINTQEELSSWNHYLFIINQTNTVGYLNGIVEQVRTNSIDSSVGNNNLFIGSNWNADSTFLNGSMDEIRIYNRALSETEIEKLYNESPYSKACDYCNTSTITLNDLRDATTYNISFLSALDGATSMGTNFFNIDLTLPIVTNNIPSEINSYLLNISDYVSCSDTNLITCNITFTPSNATVLVNQTSLYNFTYNGNQTYTILAEDIAGNKVTDTGVILVNPSFNITINNATGSPITEYYLDGVLINDTATYNIYDFGLGISKIEFSKLGFTTGNITLNLTNTSRANYNFTLPFAKLIITMYDISDYSKIFGNDFTIEIIGSSYSKQFSIVNSSNTTIIDSDITPDNYTLLVSSANYSTSFIQFAFTNQEELNLDIYLTPKVVVGETITSIIVKTLDSSKDTIGNIQTKQYVWDSSSGEYVLLNEKTTNSYGQTSYPVFLDTKLYKFCALYNGVLTCNSDIYIDESTLEILIEINTLQLISINTESIYKYDFPFSLTNTSLGGNLQEVSFVWDNDRQDISNYCLEIYLLNISKETLITSACTTSHSSGLSFQINKTENESYIAKAQIYYNGQKKLLDKLVLPKTGGGLAEELIYYGYYKIIGLIFIFGAIAIGLMPKVRTPLLSHGLLMLASIGIYTFFKGYGGIEVVGLILILNGGAILFLSKLNETGSDKEKGYKALTMVLTIFFGLLALTSMLQIMDTQGSLDSRGEEMLNYLTGTDGTNSTNQKMSTLDTKIVNLQDEIEGLEVGESSIFDIVFIKSINFFKLTWELLKSMLFLPNTILFLVGLDYILIFSKLGYIIGLIMNLFIVSYLIQRIFGK